MGKQGKPNAADFVGKSLEGFTIQKLTEVFRVDEDGRKSVSIGFFKNGAIAKALAQNATDAPYHRTEEAMVLTDGKVGFLFLADPVELLDDEKIALVIRESPGQTQPRGKKHPRGIKIV